MSILQIIAILNLLLAFGVDPAVVDRVSIILNAPKQVMVVPAPKPVEVGPAGSSAEPAVDNSPSVDIKVNNSDGPIEVSKNGCIVQGQYSCANVEVEWTSKGSISPGCGITGGYLWSGNQGVAGSLNDTLFSSTTLNIECTVPGGTINDSVRVIIK